MIRVVTIAALLLLTATAASAAKRVALVIGNNSYATLPNLANAHTDAKGMARKLKSLGFEVILKVNAGQRDLYRPLAKFEAALSDAEVGLVFYAGHGIQTGTKSYLVPSDAQIEIEDDLRAEAITSDDFLQAMTRAGTPLNIVILDACRDNPLPRRTRSAARGLAIPIVPKGIKGTAIVYSAAPGQVAQDGPRGGHGVFTGEPLKVLDQPGLTLERVFKETATRVARATNGKQDPWINSSVKGDFFFRHGAKSVPSAKAGTSAEVAFWQSIQRSKDPADFTDYLARFPKGTFVGIAERRVKELSGKQVAMAKPPNLKPMSTAKKAVSIYLKYRPGDTFWDCAECPEMVMIPAGRFKMGSPEAEASRDSDEGPAHEVTIPRPFAVGKFEVTFVEWDACVSAGGCRGYRPNDQGWGRGRRPVIDVGWTEVKAYVSWLSQKSGKTYRLLSEAEWVYIARAGTTTPFHFGLTIAPDQANYNGYFRYAGGPTGKDRQRTVEVGRFPANNFGVHDVHGNVSEMVEDCWHNSYRGALTCPQVSYQSLC